MGHVRKAVQKKKKHTLVLGSRYSNDLLNLDRLRFDQNSDEHERRRPCSFLSA